MNKQNDNSNKSILHNNKDIYIFFFILILTLIITVLFIVFSLYVHANSNDSNEIIENTGEQLEENITLIEGIQIQDDKKNDKEKSENTKEKLYKAENREKYSIIGKLNIPSLNIKYDILSSCSTELLKISLNRYWGAYPNEVGNMVVIGHNYKNNKFFGNLQKIKLGDIVKITDNKGKTLDYSVYKTDVIDPYDNSCTSQLTNGCTEITLITCYYERGSSHANKRFIVKARVN